MRRSSGQRGEYYVQLHRWGSSIAAHYATMMLRTFDDVCLGMARGMAALVAAHSICAWVVLCVLRTCMMGEPHLPPPSPPPLTSQEKITEPPPRFCSIG